MKENFVIRVYGADKMPEIPIPADYPIKQNYRSCKVLLLKLQKVTGKKKYIPDL